MLRIFGYRQRCFIALSDGLSTLIFDRFGVDVGIKNGSKVDKNQSKIDSKKVITNNMQVKVDLGWILGGSGSIRGGSGVDLVWI